MRFDAIQDYGIMSLPSYHLQISISSKFDHKGERYALLRAVSNSRNFWQTMTGQILLYLVALDR